MKNSDQDIPELVKEFLTAFPQHAKQAKGELDEVLNVFLKFCLNRSSLLTREEFAIQAKVLEKTRAKLDRLEQKLSRLEQNKA